jgi:hypothetical protein
LQIQFNKPYTLRSFDLYKRCSNMTNGWDAPTQMKIYANNGESTWTDLTPNNINFSGGDAVKYLNKTIDNNNSYSYYQFYLLRCPSTIPYTGMGEMVLYE